MPAVVILPLQNYDYYVFVDDTIFEKYDMILSVLSVGAGQV